MDQWLIRTSSNVISGPYPREQVIRFIQDGALGPQDEVCQANGYWIYLHEHQEVLRQLGIQMPRFRGADDEVTETQIEAPPSASRGLAAGALELEADGLPSMPEVPEGGDGWTTTMTHQPSSRSKAGADESRGGAQAARSIRSARAAASPRVASISPQIERPSIWRGFAWVLVVAACAIVYAVLRLLRAPQL